MINSDDDCISKFYGISKNPYTRNYIIILESIDSNLHGLLLDSKDSYLTWDDKIILLQKILKSLDDLHQNGIVHCELCSENVFVESDDPFSLIVIIYPGSCKLENDNNLISRSESENEYTYGSIPYIPPEVLRGYEFTKAGDIYSFGGIMYEIITAQHPFFDQPHDTYLMIDICNGVRPRVPDCMLSWIPEWYLSLMYRCWSDDPSKRPTTRELKDAFANRDLDLDLDTNRDLIQLPYSQCEFHQQSSYVSRQIYTLYGLQNSLEDMRSGNYEGIVY